jgi:uncharacterized membrane protein
MQPPPSIGISKHRLESLADCVFAFAMTLLILDVKLPPPMPGQSNVALLERLAYLWPKLFTFAQSFLILGTIWVGHQALFHFVRHVDRIFIWLNIVFLMLISGLPFSTALLSEHHTQAAAVVVYCGNLIAASLVMYVQLRYAAAGGRLMADNAAPELLNLAARRVLMGPTFYALAIPVAFLNTKISLAMCIFTPILYVLPGRVDSYWRGDPK